ncbi:hypothetical protein [Frankia sp. Cas4]|uniref:hypothetical protein n=1 Tax=Frankia sp. Cas4 TaxID=3073927 RepID=UPI002AD58E5F|nr:hypothetical protein [Frankia sp. Cas4]
MFDEPVSRRIVVGDIEGWSSRDSQTQKDLRRRLREVLNRAFTESQLPWREWADVAVSAADRGDGLLIMIPPDVSIVRLLDPFVDRLAVALRHDRLLHSDWARMRLRLAIHDGEVLPEGSGWAGHDVIEACRLVDAEPLRQALRDEPEADLVVIVSERVHRAAVRDGYGNIRPETFTEVDVVVKTYQARAWVHVPGIGIAEPSSPRKEPAAVNRTHQDGSRKEPGMPPDDEDDHTEGDYPDPTDNAVSYGTQFKDSSIQLTVSGGNVILGGRQGRVVGRDNQENHGGRVG